ncbi:MAG TPA: M3 family metallopeptidase, partial [Hyphomicrobiaceae bacterium]|nr:M3 family metallopeptidase [Hyphomicrobiaceae bacterium]
EFARHYAIGAPMPEAMIEKLHKARTFNQGFATVEFLASAIVDLEIHSRPIGDGDDPMAIEAETLARIGMPAQIAMRHRTPHFNHVFAGGYAAGYYSYLWSEVLDADAFAAFEEAGDIFDAATAERLKRFIYSAGGSRKEEEAYLAFRGRMPSVDGLLRKRGLVAG